MKNIAILCIIIFLSATASAQFGVKAGLTHTGTLGGDKLVKEKSYGTGYTVGVFYDRCLGCDFSLRPELNYTERSSNYSIGDIAFKNTHRYLEVPVNIHLKIYKPLFVSLGPQFMYRLSSEVDATKKSGTVKLSDVNKVFAKYDIGINASFGLDYKNFFVDLRAYRGFRSLFKGDKTLELKEQSTKNLNFDFSVGYKF